MNIVILNPEGAWLKRIEIGHIIWLVKEQKEAIVKSKHKTNPFYSLLDTNPYMGNIDLCIDGQDVNWNVSISGRGFDGSLLMLPIENNILSIEEYEYKSDLEFCNRCDISVEEFRAFVKKLKGKYPNSRLVAMILIEMDMEFIRDIILFETNSNILSAEDKKIEWLQPKPEHVLIPEFEIIYDPELEIY